MMNNKMITEVQEAIYAGERALNSLRAAQEELGRAKNWGIVDLLGGGFFTDMIKHSKMRNASECLEMAKHDLHKFERELKDVSVHAELKMDIGDFLVFADFFFDGLITDYLVQSRIADAREDVAHAIWQVEHIIADLKKMIY